MADLKVGMIKGILITIIMVVILFTMLNDTATDVMDSANNLTEEVNASGHCVSGATGGCTAQSTYPLMNFFKQKGVLLLAFIAGIVLVIISAVLGNKK